MIGPLMTGSAMTGPMITGRCCTGSGRSARRVPGAAASILPGALLAFLAEVPFVHRRLVDRCNGRGFRPNRRHAAA